MIKSQKFIKTLKLLIIFLLLMSFTVLFNIFNYLTKTEISVTFVNVGQGDATLIHTFNNKNILIDTGKENFGIENIEKSLIENSNSATIFSNKTNIDSLILTHSDVDHSGKAIYFIDNYSPENIFMNNILYFNELQKSVSDKNIRFKNVYIGQSIDFTNYKNTSTGTMSFINPIQNKLYIDENEGGVGTIFTYGKYNFILMADIGKNTENQILKDKNNPLQNIIKDNCLNCINILKVGHHGSKTSSDENFLKTLSPEYCIISVGKNNYGHPNPETLKTLDKYCKKIYRTDIDNNIKFKINTIGLEVISN